MEGARVRQPGFYWVKHLFAVDWVVAEWSQCESGAEGYWATIDGEDVYEDSYFQEIDERRIEREA